MKTPQPATRWQQKTGCSLISYRIKEQPVLS
jgi:hypothetical protein